MSKIFHPLATNFARQTSKLELGMTLDKLLDKFYFENGIPENGGTAKDTFEMEVFGFNLKLPNPKFRKDVTHIHDIQHILNECDTSWKGEGFIAGWEIATGFWKYFPICIFSFWAMGYSFWLYPKSVYEGYKKGLNDIGIIELNIGKTEFLQMELSELVKITSRKEKRRMNFIRKAKFLFWVVIGQIVFTAPFFLILLGVLMVY